MVSMRSGSPGHRRLRALVATLTAVALVALAACTPQPDEEAAPDPTDHFGYLLNAPLVTTNAGSQVGVSTNAQLISSRLYPAVFVPGPTGQMIPNTDLVHTQVLPGTQRQVIYTLSDEARYSDGEPVTCTDFLLHYKAGVMAGLFGSHLPLTAQIERMDCTPGAKRFTVVFQEDAGERWRHLFGPGSVLPAHIIAREAGLSEAELVDALDAEDPTQLGEVARLWREGFSLRDFNPAFHVSAGPFLVDSVGEHGEVTLVRNDNYFGDHARLPSLVVWPQDTDAAQLVGDGALRVADITGPDPDWIDRDDPANPFIFESRVGDLTDSLMLGDAGVFGSPEARQAFAACVDQPAVAEASAAVAGVEVPPVTVRSVAHYDPMRYQLADIADPHLGVDLERAGALAGATVRLGYPTPNERKAAMVEAIRLSCEPAGVTVVDASAEGGSLTDLAHLTVGQWGQQEFHDGPLDAVLLAVDPMAEFPAASARASRTEALRETEQTLWEEVPTIPLAAQPRTFAVDRSVGNLVVYTGVAGIGWNMDRWQATNEDDSGPTDPEPAGE